MSDPTLSVRVSLPPDNRGEDGIKHAIREAKKSGCGEWREWRIGNEAHGAMGSPAQIEGIAVVIDYDRPTAFELEFSDVPIQR